MIGERAGTPPDTVQCRQRCTCPLLLCAPQACASDARMHPPCTHVHALTCVYPVFMGAIETCTPDSRMRPKHMRSPPTPFPLQHWCGVQVGVHGRCGEPSPHCRQHRCPCQAHHRPVHRGQACLALSSRGSLRVAWRRYMCWCLCIGVPTGSP